MVRGSEEDGVCAPVHPGAPVHILPVAGLALCDVPARRRKEICCTNT